MKKVVIHIKDGFAHVVRLPKDVEVVLMDFDLIDVDPPGTIFVETAIFKDNEIIYSSEYVEDNSITN